MSIQNHHEHPLHFAPISALARDFLPRDCTFNADDWAILARQWFPVARVLDIQDKPVAATLLDLRLVVYRTAQGISIGRDLCPHRGVPLSMGSVQGDELVCPYHGLRYQANGQCTRIPAHPDLTPSSKFRVTMFPAIERYGLVWTCLLPEETCDIPPLPEWDDPQYQPILPPPVDIAGSAGRQVEGFVDVAHFAFVHHEAFADPDNAVVPSYHTELTPYGLQTDYWSTVSNYPKPLQHLAPPDFQWLRHFEVYPPFTAKLTVHFPDDGLLHIMNIASPVSARKTRLFVPIARNFDTDGPLEPVHAFNAQIFAEDQALVEQQYPEDLPLDMQMEAHFAADRTSVAYRRLLKNMGLSLAYSA